ncbi:MAG: DJ-1 family glyoxalase III [Bacteroidota bacterium]|jgi:DJ-1 family protein
MAKVLVPISNGTEEMEAVIIIDMLRRGGCEVVVAGDGDVVVCAWGTRLLPDIMIDDIADDDAFDAIVLPGGSQGVSNFSRSAALESILRRHAAGRGLIGAICAAPVVLHDFKLLPERAVVTSHPGVADVLAPYTYTLDRVASDGSFITSRGAGTAVEFSLALLRRLADEKSARRVASDIVLYE